MSDSGVRLGAVGVALLVVACGARAPARRPSPRGAGPLVPTPTRIAGPEDGRGERSCNAEESALGRVTVAGNWGPGRTFIGCRTGPSPRTDLVRRLRSTPWLGACVRAAGVSYLALAFDVAGTGAVRSIEIEEVDPAPAPPALGACLRRASAIAFLPMSCRWQGRFFYLSLGLSAP